MESVRGNLLVILAVLIAGCLGPLGDETPNGPGPVPDGIELPRYVDNGSWASFEVNAEPDKGYTWGVKSETDYENYQVRSEDAFDCRAGATKDGWSEILRISSRDTASTYFGVRNSAESRWNGGQYGDVGDSSGWGILGAPNDAEGLRVLLATETFGPGVTSSLWLDDSSEPVTQSDVGKFWCLSGVSRYAEGSYIVTNDYVDAEGLVWTTDVQDGILLRVLATADQGSWRLVGPAGERYAGPPVIAGSSLDQTFCSATAGPWSFEIENLRSEPGKPWQFVVFVFDTADPIPPCHNSWQTSELI